MTTASMDKLSELVVRYGGKVTDDAQFCGAILGDHKSFFKRREIDALTSCVRLGIPARMLANRQGFPLAAQKQDVAERLYDEIGLDRSLAEWCAEAWSVALNLQAAPSPTRPVDDQGATALDRGAAAQMPTLHRAAPNRNTPAYPPYGIAGQGFADFYNA